VRAAASDCREPFVVPVDRPTTDHRNPMNRRTLPVRLHPRPVSAAASVFATFCEWLISWLIPIAESVVGAAFLLMLCLVPA
jgi:hypothetical protein